jgi:hypothetical protein
VPIRWPVRLGLRRDTSRIGYDADRLRALKDEVGRTRSRCSGPTG